MTPPVVIISCGALKLPHPAPAAELYVGQHFRAQLTAARALTPDARVFILSARYGLVRLADVIAPYDLTIGQPGAICAAHITEQARHMRLDHERRVIVLAPARYAALCRRTWPALETPLAGLGIGYQRAALARIRRDGLPAPAAALQTVTPER